MASTSQHISLTIAVDLESIQNDPLFMFTSVKDDRSEMTTQLPPNLLPIAPNVIFCPLTITITQPQISGHYTVNQQQMWSTYNPNLAPQKRRCALCKEAGRDGSDCPGKSN
jgi:hypothetical protein